MNIVCVICSDLLIPSDDVFYTPCGHIFHFACLTQWLERSKSCPQCREKTTGTKIHRIYFNFSNNDTVVEDAACLQDRVDKLKFQILLKDNEIKQFSEKNSILEKQTAGLRKEVRSVEAELASKNTAIHALKDQIKYFKEQCAEVDNARREINRLQKKVEEYKNVQVLLDNPSEDVNDMIQRTTDPNTLITYISVMKREMVTCLKKRKDLRAKVKGLQQDLTKVSMERNFLAEEHSKRKKLEEDLSKSEAEKAALQDEITKLKSEISNHKCAQTYVKMDKLVNSPELRLNIDEPRSMETKKPQRQLPKIIENRVLPCPTNKENGENSPYLPIKSQGVFTRIAERRPTINLGSSILAKRPRIDQSEPQRSASSSTITYDGLGGHSKFDPFPSSNSIERFKKPRMDGNTVKRTKSDLGQSKPLFDFGLTKSSTNNKDT